ncbi:MAG: hypothetical protein ACR2OE_12790 [Thermomicrobiales bacterium]
MFRGMDKYATPGGDDSIITPQTPPDTRLAIGQTHITYVIVNGPITVRNRDAVEQVIRTLDSRGGQTMTIITRNNGAIIDSNTGDMSYNAGLRVVQVSPGIIQIDIPPSAITTAMLTDALITAQKIAAGAVGTTALADGAVTTAKLGPGAVMSGNMATNAIGAAAIIDGSVTAAELAAGAVGTVAIADANVTIAKLATNSVDSNKIIDNSIVNADLATNAVDYRVIAGGAVNQNIIAIGGVWPTNLSSDVFPTLSLVPLATFGTYSATFAPLQYSFTPTAGRAFRWMVTGTLHAEGAAGALADGSLQITMSGSGAGSGPQTRTIYEAGVNATNEASHASGVSNCSGTYTWYLAWNRTSGSITTYGGMLKIIIWYTL